MGLSISKKLVSLMGGKIWVESTFSKGSTFSFSLPLKEATTPDSNVHIMSDSDNTVTVVNALEGIKILVAEDNKMNQMVLKMLLEDSHLELDFANDGAIAVEKFRAYQYDLVLMDIQMPHMNGYEATKIIKEIDVNTPIIALSANVMKEDIEKSKEVGMNDYLTKPIDVDKLYHMLWHYLVQDKH